MLALVQKSNKHTDCLPLGGVGGMAPWAAHRRQRGSYRRSLAWEKITVLSFLLTVCCFHNMGKVRNHNARTFCSVCRYACWLRGRSYQHAQEQRRKLVEEAGEGSWALATAWRICKCVWLRTLERAHTSGEEVVFSLVDAALNTTRTSYAQQMDSRQQGFSTSAPLPFCPGYFFVTETVLCI